MIKTILVLGAGRSSASLINYLLEQGYQKGWKIIVGDFSQTAAKERIGDSSIGTAIHFDINDVQSSADTITKADLVISLLPAALHPLVAKQCLRFNKHLFTASYVSEEMLHFDTEAKTKNLLFLNECGLDPGIDHMSAMQVIDRIKAGGGKLTSFESFTGGLIAPETDPENPWRYKFTWNARNVVVAGQSTAKYLHDGEYKYIPYQQLFTRLTPVNVVGHGAFEGYANRDSLKYIETYGLQDIRTMLRGTLRNKGFCESWNMFVQLGCCDDTYKMEGVEKMTHVRFLDAFLPSHPSATVREKLEARFGRQYKDSFDRLAWSGFFDDERVGLSEGTPAQILEHILNKRWKLQPGDKDLIVMWHRFVYQQNGVTKEIQASLIAKGTDATETAMAKTVGLPLGIAAKLLANGKIKARGVQLPIDKTFYEPILAELKLYGIDLVEQER